MNLTIIGCSGSFPSAWSPASCYLLEHEGVRIVLDLGNGALGALAGHAELGSIDAVLLTHLHVDHCIDMCSFYVARTYGPTGPQPAIPVLGPRGTADRLATAYGMDTDPGMRERFSFREYPSGAATGHTHIGPFEIGSAPMVHPVPDYALRVTAGGRTLVFSGDTGPHQGLIDVSRGADLLLYEASYLEEPGRPNPPDVHLSARQAAEHAGAADVGRLVLTHLVAWNPRERSMHEAASHYDGDLRCAEPGLTIVV